MKSTYRNPLLRNFVLAATVCLTFGQPVNAGSVYWDTNNTATGSGVATGTWGTSAFWTTTEAGTATPTGTVPTANDDVFIAAGTNGTTGTITINTTKVAGSLTLQEPAANPGITISGGTSLTLGGGTTATKGLFVTGNGTHIVSTPLILSGANTIQNGGTGTLTVNGGITGTGNLTLRNNSTGAISIVAQPVDVTGAITNTGTSTGFVLIGNANATPVTAGTGSGGLGANITSFTQDSATAPLEFRNANNSAYAGSYDINAGTLHWGGTNTGGTVTATNAASVINLGATSGTAAATMNVINNAVSGKLNNNILVRAGSTGTKTIGVALTGSSVTFATTGTITLDDNVTLNPNTTAFLNPNGLISDGANGAKGITKAGPGTVNLSHSHPFSGATTVSNGTLVLTSAGGSLPNTSGITVSGGTFQLNNTTANNNAARIPDSTVITMTGGTLDFKNDAGAADFSETVAVTAAGTGTLNASQAASGQTSTLTIGTFVRNPGSTLSFTGTDLGVDDRNRILFTTPPALTNGVLPWATINATSFATYDLTNGVIPATTSDIDAQGSTITNDFTSNLRILPDGTGSAIALEATDTTINTLVQANTTLATTPTIDTALKTLRLNSILLSSTANTKGLTIGSAANDGTLTPGTPGGEFFLINNSASTLTLNAVIANNTSASLLSKSGSGNVIFAGANIYTGDTSLKGGIITAADSSAFGTGYVTILPTTTRVVVNNGLNVANKFIFNGGGAGSRGVFENSAAGGNATLSGAITISGTLAGGGHFASFGAGGTLTVAGPVTSTGFVSSRLGTVIFSGGGSYPSFVINEGTVKLGADNGLSTSATVDVAASDAGVFDLNGYDQTLVGVTRTQAKTATIGNGSDTNDSTLTTTGTATYAGNIANVIGAPLTPQTTSLVVSSGNLTLTGGFTAQNITINNGGTLTIGAGGGDGIWPVSNLITIDSGGTLKFTGDNRIKNNTVIDIPDGATFDTNGKTDVVGHIKGGGSITNLNNTLNLALPAVGSPAEFSGTISGTATTVSALVLRCDGTGASAASTLTLSGDNTGLTATGTNSTVNVQGGRVIGRNAAAFGPAGQIVTVGAAALTLDPTVEFGDNNPLNSYVLNIGSGNTGTIELNRKDAGPAFTQPAGTSTIGNATLNIEKGANVTGTPVLEFASISLSAGGAGLGAATLNPVGVDISVLGAITRPGTAAANLKLDGTSTGNTIAGAMLDKDATNKLTVTKQNTGTWTLGGTNTYTGNTSITGGTLALGAAGSIANSPALSISAGAKLDTTAKTSYTLPATVTIGINGTTGTNGLIDASGKELVISGATVNFDETGILTAPVYVLANYATIAGTVAFASVETVSGYKLVYDYEGNKIALVRSPYDTWGAPYGLATGSEAGDLDHDGLTNFEEFAFGLIPNSGSSVNPITVPLDKTTGQFTYQRLAASGLTYTIWTSTDLDTWTQDPTAVQTPTAAGANESVQVTLSATPKPLTAPKLFVRVQAD